MGKEVLSEEDASIREAMFSLFHKELSNEEYEVAVNIRNQDKQAGDESLSHLTKFFRNQDFVAPAVTASIMAAYIDNGEKEKRDAIVAKATATTTMGLLDDFYNHPEEYKQHLQNLLSACDELPTTEAMAVCETARTTDQQLRAQSLPSGAVCINGWCGPQ